MRVEGFIVRVLTYLCQIVRLSVFCCLLSVYSGQAWAERDATGFVAYSIHHGLSDDDITKVRGLIKSTEVFEKRTSKIII